MFPNITTLKQDISRMRREGGFTLPEIATALLVFGILCAIAIPIFLAQQGGIAAASLETLLLSASNSVENEKEANNGLYPIYTPYDFIETSQLNGFKYYYSPGQDGYCIEGSKDGKTMYIGTATGGKVSAVSCVGSYTEGGENPSDANTRPAPPSQSSPKIASLSPDSQVGRQQSQMITVLGSNFVPGATVLFGNKTIPAIVANAGTLTFVSPGFDSYTKVPVQVFNPTKRSSNIAEYEFINPIIGTTATAPTVAISSKTPTDAKVTASVISCPFEATPYYSFTLTQKGNAVEPDGIAWRDLNGRDVSQWSASNSFTFTNPNQGMQYTAKARAICNLEGTYGNPSTYSSPLTWTHSVSTPTTPIGAPVPSQNALLINETINFVIPTYTTCPTGTTVSSYRLYDGVSLIGGTTNTATNRSFVAATTAAAKTYSYSVVCSSQWANSNESTKSPTTSINVYSSVPAPSPATALGVSAGYTSTTLGWSSVNCLLGSPEYGYYVSTTGTTSSFSTALNQVYNHTEGRIYNWATQAKCVYTPGARYESSVTRGSSNAFSSLIHGPSGAPSNLSGNGATYSWSGISCGAGATPTYYAWQSKVDTTAGGWVGQNWTSSNSATLGSYHEGSQQVVNVIARCDGYAGDNIVSAGSGTTSLTYNIGITSTGNPGSRWWRRYAFKDYGLVGVDAGCPAGTSLQYSMLIRWNGFTAGETYGPLDNTSRAYFGWTANNWYSYQFDARTRCVTAYVTGPWGGWVETNYSWV